MDMIRNVDLNSNGAIDFTEFLEMMVKRGGGSQVDDDVEHAFKGWRWFDIQGGTQADHEQSRRTSDGGGNDTDD